MRLWSLHPSYLDTKGLVALWREALLAKKVISGRTRGYKNHPQLTRFRNHEQPLRAISFYLSGIWQEGRRRGYCFDRRKFRLPATVKRIRVTRGQLCYEYRRLCRKLRQRCPASLAVFRRGNKIRPHPLFRPVPGQVENWEKIAKVH